MLRVTWRCSGQKPHTNSVLIPCWPTNLVRRSLRIVNPSPYMVYLQARSCILVASSPEILCRVDQSRIVTNRPLAGTRPRGATVEEDKALEADLLAGTPPIFLLLQLAIVPTFRSDMVWISHVPYNRFIFKHMFSTCVFIKDSEQYNDKWWLLGLHESRVLVMLPSDQTSDTACQCYMTSNFANQLNVT